MPEPFGNAFHASSGKTSTASTTASADSAPRSEILAGPHRFCTEVKFSSHQFRGVADDTLPHDEGWQFLRAGRALERAEKTARIVDVEYHTLLEGRMAHEPDNHQWMAVLKSVAAYEVYRREFHSSIDPQRVAELLVLHPRHPRSIRFNIGELQASLQAISRATPGTYCNRGRTPDRKAPRNAALRPDGGHFRSRTPRIPAKPAADLPRDRRAHRAQILLLRSGVEPHLNR